VCICIFIRSNTLHRINNTKIFCTAGTLFAALYGAQGGVVRMSGVNDPLGATLLQNIDRLDGISVGVNVYDVEQPPYVICNNNDGTLKMVFLLHFCLQ
jgi:hypothetical protein